MGDREGKICEGKILSMDRMMLAKVLTATETTTTKPLPPPKKKSEIWSVARASRTLHSRTSAIDRDRQEDTIVVHVYSRHCNGVRDAYLPACMNLCFIHSLDFRG